MGLLKLIFAFALVQQSKTFELQDTIHKLIEENIHLHDQLENLTQALKELKLMLIHHSNDPGHHENEIHHNENIEHLWDEWSQHGISTETHHFLEQVFCEQDLHGSTAPLIKACHVFLYALSTVILLLTYGQLY